MLRYLATLLVVLHVVSSQVPPTCSTCSRDKAALIGKVTCDAQGRLTTQCSKGPIQMKVDGKYYALNRVTCIEGEWFGTSCSGIAIYLSTVLPESTCPEIDFPEYELPGTNCTIRPIGLPDVYDQNFVQFPQLTGWGFHTCEDKPHWNKFRQTEKIYEKEYGGMYIRKDDGIEKINSILKCVINPETGKYQLQSSGGAQDYFLESNQIECIFTKCPSFLSYNKISGRCEPLNVHAAGYALEYASYAKDFVNSYELPRYDKTNVTFKVTHIVSFPECRITVYGSKKDLMNYTQLSIVKDQTYGLWSIYSVKEPDYNPAFNLPVFIVSICDNYALNAPYTDGVWTGEKYQLSHESKYYSLTMGDDVELNGAASPGVSFSFYGSGTGVLSSKFIESMSSYVLEITLNFSTKKLTYNYTSDENVEMGERDLFVDSARFHVRFIPADYNTIEVHLNGRFVYRFSNPNFTIGQIRVSRKNLALGKCHFFVPKECSYGHRFSDKTADCEWELPSSKCAVIKDVSPGPMYWNHVLEVVQSNTMPPALEYKANFIEVRQGCIAYAYNGEDSSPRWMNGDSVLNHGRGRYNFPNLEFGTCIRRERGLKNIECYCENYNKNPGHQGEFLEVPIDSADNFVFSAYLTETSPMAQFGLVADNGNMWLVLFIGDGKLIADMQLGDGCYYQHFEMAEKFPVRKGDRFECRIRLAENGYEIRINGVAVLEYPYSFGFEVYGNFGAHQIVKARFVHGLTLVHYRLDRENSYIVGGGQEHERATIAPFLFGDYVHFNGMSVGPFNITLAGYDPEDPVERRPRFVLDADPSQNTIVQKLYTKKGVKTVTSTCSLFSGVEVDIVIVSKPHSVEVFVNGVILSVLGESIAEEKCDLAQVKGDTVKIFDLRKGPNKIDHPHEWSNAG